MPEVQQTRANKIMQAHVFADSDKSNHHDRFPEIVWLCIRFIMGKRLTRGMEMCLWMYMSSEVKDSGDAT